MFKSQALVTWPSALTMKLARVPVPYSLHAPQTESPSDKIDLLRYQRYGPVHYIPSCPDSYCFRYLNRCTGRSFVNSVSHLLLSCCPTDVSYRDLSHINTPATVEGFSSDNDGLAKALQGIDIVIIPAGVPRKPGMTRFV